MQRRFTSRPDWQIALVMAAGMRLLYTALAIAFVPFLHPDPATIRTNALTENLPSPHGLYYSLLGVWERFDTLWFLRIAEHGYDRLQAVVFYPLYPAAIHIVGVAMPPIAAALVVSTMAAFFAFWGLLRLAGELSEVGRLRTLLLLCVWPASFILFAGYADSLTLALVVWTIVLGREGRWELATACAILTGVARPTGATVFIPLVLMALQSRQARSLVVALTPLGLLSYWGWLRWSGRPSVVEGYRGFQGMTMVPPWKGLGEVLHLIVSDHDEMLAIKLGMVVVFLSTSLYRRMRSEDKAFIVAVILQMLMYTGRPLLGGARYLLIIYPSFLVFGNWAERWSGRQLAFYMTIFGLLNLAWMWAFLNWSLVL